MVADTIKTITLGSVLCSFRFPPSLSSALAVDTLSASPATTALRTFFALATGNASFTLELLRVIAQARIAPPRSNIRSAFTFAPAFFHFSCLAFYFPASRDVAITRWCFVTTVAAFASPETRSTFAPTHVPSGRIAVCSLVTMVLQKTFSSILWGI